MTAAPKIPIEDLVTEYQLHEDRRHLYVEGGTDYTVLRWYLEPISANGVEIFDISTVEITGEQLAQHQLGRGNKSKLLVLARELAASLPDNSRHVLCIADADFDYVLDRLEDNRFLAYTDGTSMEMYVFSEVLVERVVRLGLGNFHVEPTVIVDSLYEVLRDVFIIRATNESLQLGLTWLPFERRCGVAADGTLTFDREKFIGDYLRHNGATHLKNEFLVRKAELESRELDSRTRWMRGHDLSTLLMRYCKKSGGNVVGQKVANCECLEKMLFVGLERSRLQAEPLFRRVNEFVE